MKPFLSARRASRPKGGWIVAIREALGMTLGQLGKRAGRSTATIKNMQLREEAGTITLRTLGQLAEAMDMQLVYALVPRTEVNLSRYFERRLQTVSQQIVRRTNDTMALEDQKIRTERLRSSRTEIARELAQTPKKLWE